MKRWECQGQVLVLRFCYSCVLTEAGGKRGWRRMVSCAVYVTEGWLVAPET